MAARLAARVRQRALETRVGEACEAVADLLPGALELARAAKPCGGLAEGAVDGLAEPTLVVRAPALAVSTATAQSLPCSTDEAEIVAEAEALAHLLEEARVRVGADDLDGEREREHARAAPRGAAMSRTRYTCGKSSPVQADGARAARRGRGGRARRARERGGNVRRTARRVARG